MDDKTGFVIDELGIRLVLKDDSVESPVGDVIQAVKDAVREYGYKVIFYSSWPAFRRMATGEAAFLESKLVQRDDSDD